MRQFDTGCYRFCNNLYFSKKSCKNAGMCDLYRYRKCLSCHNKLLSIRSDLEQKTNQYDGRLRQKIEEMLQLCQKFTQL